MEFPKFEKQEKPDFSSRVIGVEDLKNIIYKGKQTVQDFRFLPLDKGGVFRYFNLRDIVGAFTKNLENKYYPVAELNEEIAGMAELERDPYRENNLWIKFISVDPKYQGQGCASKLIEDIFKFAKEQGCSLEESFYSDDGEQKLKKIVRESAEKFGVELIFHK